MGTELQIMDEVRKQEVFFITTLWKSCHCISRGWSGVWSISSWTVLPLEREARADRCCGGIGFEDEKNEKQWFAVGPLIFPLQQFTLYWSCS